MCGKFVPVAAQVTSEPTRYNIHSDRIRKEMEDGIEKEKLVSFNSLLKIYGY